MPIIERGAVSPLIVSTYDSAGGAARAAQRLGIALNESDIPTTMLTAVKASDLHWVTGQRGIGGSVKAALRARAGALWLRRQKVADLTFRSANRWPSRLDRTIAALPHDVINLHWIGSEMLSIEEIGRLNKPVIWTLHDMWAFTGTEHYAPDDADARWRAGYTAANRPKDARGKDIDRTTWERKMRSWRRPQHVVTPSNWLADCVRGSALMHDWPVTVIPNPVDLQRFRPWPKALAREMLGLPADVPLLAYGAMGGTSDPRKGWDLLLPALRDVAAAKIGAQAVVFGQGRPAQLPDLPLPTHFIGHLSEDLMLALMYSAVDAVVVPSRQDNLPQTATEPQACGTPVVAFDVGGLPDAVIHGRTGLLVEPFDSPAMAAAILHLLGDPDLRSRMGATGRDRALRLWNPNSIADLYRNVYEEEISKYQ